MKPIQTTESPLALLIARSASVLVAESDQNITSVGVRFPDATEEFVLLWEEKEEVFASLPIPGGMTGGYVVGKGGEHPSINRGELAAIGLFAHELLATAHPETEKRPESKGPRRIPERFRALMAYGRSVKGPEEEVTLIAIHGDGAVISVGQERLRIDLTRSGNLCLRTRTAEGKEKVLAVSRADTSPDVLGHPPLVKGEPWTNTRWIKGEFVPFTP